jgi:hypothetical protein
LCGPSATRHPAISRIKRLFRVGRPGGRACFTPREKRLAKRAFGRFLVKFLKAPDGQVHHLVDPTAMMRVFITSNGIFGSYISALKSQRLTLNTCDVEGLVEFLNYGRFGANYTHHPSVTSLRGSDRLEIDTDGKVQLHERPLADLIEHQGESVDTVFSHLATALEGRRVAVDLTGGMDSRLVVALLHAHGLAFDTGLSGMKGYTEFKTAQRVAERLGRQFNRYGHVIDNLELDLRRAVKRSEGLLDALYSHRPTMMQESRAAAGFEVVVGGLGGEMINDFAMLHDLPFIGRRHADLERFFDLRLLPVPMPEKLLAGPYRQAQAGLKQRMLCRLEGFRRESAAATYLNIYYAHRMSAAAGAALTANLKMGVAQLAPFMDYELFAGTYDLPFRERFASRHHRRLIATAAPEIRGLPSSTGMVVRGGIVGEVEDLLRFGLRLAGRAKRKAEQRFFQRALRQESPDHPQLVQRLRQGGLAQEALNSLQDRGVLAQELSLEELPDPWLGNVVTLHLFAELLEA